MPFVVLSLIYCFPMILCVTIDIVIVLFINPLYIVLDHPARNYCFYSMHVNICRHTHLHL
uniref:Uncharacterized protein n=1 Tax=Arundo donax TaxID=35708 RepID=A0A0A9GDE0_ARUDO